MDNDCESRKFFCDAEGDAEPKDEAKELGRRPDAKGALGGARSLLAMFLALANGLGPTGVVLMSGLADVGGGDGDEYAEIVKPETPEDAVRRWGWEDKLGGQTEVSKNGGAYMGMEVRSEGAGRERQ